MEQIEKELLAIVYAIEKFHYYVYGKKFIVQSDHKPLETILKKEITKVTSRLQRMRLKLIKCDFKVTYTPGKHIYVADTLSRAYLKDPVSDYPELESVVHLVSKYLAVTPEKEKYSKKKPRKTKYQNS
ncbi:hypothetical protein Zmor_015290 [Zophobas morio]|uniref:Reverse transcriptase RNase H-like domain-containing protein n=1 Tax=Zophobas morio TaxID=2755281 RepID=A0AA38IJP1_9CUCU|nr:hypothetical protein Zmor_015290 [Zophobas morio]